MLAELSCKRCRQMFPAWLNCCCLRWGLWGFLWDVPLLLAAASVSQEGCCCCEQMLAHATCFYRVFAHEELSYSVAHREQKEHATAAVWLACTVFKRYQLGAESSLALIWATDAHLAATRMWDWWGDVITKTHSGILVAQSMLSSGLLIPNLPSFIVIHHICKHIMNVHNISTMHLMNAQFLHEFNFARNRSICIHRMSSPLSLKPT